MHGMKNNALLAVLLLALIILGIGVSLYVYADIVGGQWVLAGTFFVVFCITALLAAKIMSEFRHLYKMIRARNRIIHLMVPLVGDERHARAFAEGVVVGATDLASWQELPADTMQALRNILADYRLIKKPIQQNKH